jgi:hypothetical protein
VITLAGNCLYRSGAPNWGTIADPHLSTHIRFEGLRGISFTGNTVNAGRDDGGGVFFKQKLQEAFWLRTGGSFGQAPSPELNGGLG